MKVVFKYELELGKALIPHGCDDRIVHIGLDPLKRPCVWIEHRSEDRDEMFVFVTYGTGHPIEDDDRHVASFVDGAFVWHVYRREWDEITGESP